MHGGLIVPLITTSDTVTPFRKLVCTWVWRVCAVVFAFVLAYRSQRWQRPPLWERKLPFKNCWLMPDPNESNLMAIEYADSAGPIGPPRILVLNSQSGAIEESSSLENKGKNLRHYNVWPLAWDRVLYQLVAVDAGADEPVPAQLFNRRLQHLATLNDLAGDDVGYAEQRDAVTAVDVGTDAAGGKTKFLRTAPLDRSRPFQIVGTTSSNDSQHVSFTLLPHGSHVAVVKVGSAEAEFFEVRVFDLETNSLVHTYQGEFPHGPLSKRHNFQPPIYRTRLVDQCLCVERTVLGIGESALADTSVESVMLEWNGRRLILVPNESLRYRVDRQVRIHEERLTTPYWYRFTATDSPTFAQVKQDFHSFGLGEGFDRWLGWLEPEPIESIVDERDGRTCRWWPQYREPCNYKLLAERRIVVLQATETGVLRAFKLDPIMPNWLASIVVGLGTFVGLQLLSWFANLLYVLRRKMRVNASPRPGFSEVR